jgi:hypothetical protein
VRGHSEHLEAATGPKAMRQTMRHEPHLTLAGLPLNFTRKRRISSFKFVVCLSRRPRRDRRRWQACHEGGVRASGRLSVYESRASSEISSWSYIL